MNHLLLFGLLVAGVGAACAQGSYSYSSYSYPGWGYSSGYDYSSTHPVHPRMCDAGDLEERVDCLQNELENMRHEFSMLLHSFGIFAPEPLVPGPADLALSLTDGGNSSTGRVEVSTNGMHGTICDDSWDDCDARVVCRSLGYDTGRAVQYACFGEGSGDILLDEVNCNGDENSLSDCMMNPVGHHDCSHYEDAGVICYDDPTATDDCQSYYDHDYLPDRDGLCHYSASSYSSTYPSTYSTTYPSTYSTTYTSTYSTTYPSTYSTTYPSTQYTSSTPSFIKRAARRKRAVKREAPAKNE